MSGGVEDAKGLEGEFPWYRYGGMVCLVLCFLSCVGSSGMELDSAKRVLEAISWLERGQMLMVVKVDKCFWEEGLGVEIKEFV